jgi:hypothetical protein
LISGGALSNSSAGRTIQFGAKAISPSTGYGATGTGKNSARRLRPEDCAGLVFLAPLRWFRRFPGLFLSSQIGHNRRSMNTWLMGAARTQTQTAQFYSSETESILLHSE